MDYVERVNRAIDYIVRNLSQPLSLEVVSEAACPRTVACIRVDRAGEGFIPLGWRLSVGPAVDPLQLAQLRIRNARPVRYAEASRR